MAGLYLALRSVGGTKTVNLTDPSKYNIRSPATGPEWMPAVAAPVGDRYTDVVESLPIEVLGTTGAIKLQNLAAITELVDQAAAWENGEPVSPVVLDVSVPGSAPRRVLSRLVKGWVADGMLPGDFYHRVDLMDGFITAINLACAGELLHTSWWNPNLMLSSIWTTDPSWVASAGTLTFTNATTAGKASGWYSNPSTFAGAARTFTSGSAQISVVSGQTYTVSIRVADTLGGTAILTLRDASNASTISSTPAAQAVPAGGSVTSGGTVLTFVITATSTDAAARLRLTFTPASAVADTIQFCEPMVLTGSFTNAEEPWHPSWSETTEQTTSSSQNPVVQTVSLPFGDTLSPVDIQANLNTGLSTLPESYIIASPGDITIKDITTAASAPWSAVATGATDFAQANSIRRYTAAGTAESELALDSLSAPLSGPVVVFGVARNNAAAVSFLAKLRFKSGTGVTLAETTGITIPANATNPTWYPLGIAYIPEPGSQLPYLVVQASSAAGSPTVDFDQVVYVPIKRGTQIFWLDQLVATSALGGFKIKHRLLDASAMQLSSWTFGGAWTPSTAIPGSYRSAGIARMKDTLNVLWLGANNADWRISTGATPLNTQITITRTPSYVTPR